ncbi:hypothetical protein IQ37_00595 [Chryseobacterium piperi]|uniref:Uncharacterized protein n=1 Tax=Chryseobacterium piperi TaxID=558152 RepID=A0A086BMZ9_9FLAO|nr:hypothetical protein [Chryseobacterium piperi]ASW75109.1 hypothetical protein CJF12_13000 [Chryseobacterium piperi]KFF30313.1 hypothetical protein IQ37_00595 [Chryseobacterium piperi]
MRKILFFPPIFPVTLFPDQYGAEPLFILNDQNKTVPLISGLQNQILTTLSKQTRDYSFEYIPDSYLINLNEIKPFNKNIDGFVISDYSKLKVLQRKRKTTKHYRKIIKSKQII